MERVVVDTSVFVSALLSKGKTSGPARLLENWRLEKFELILSPQILKEYVIVFRRQKISDAVITNFLEVLKHKACFISGVYEATRLDDVDPADNKFLAAVYESRPNYLVSLDGHLLSMKHYHGTQIVIPTLFLRVLESREEVPSVYSVSISAN